MLGRTSVTNGPRARNGKEALLDIRQQRVVCAGVCACAKRVRVYMCVCVRRVGEKRESSFGGTDGTEYRANRETRTGNDFME